MWIVGPFMVNSADVNVTLQCLFMVLHNDIEALEMFNQEKHYFC